MLTDHVVQVVVQKMPEIVQAQTQDHWSRDSTIALLGCLASIGGAVGAIWAARIAKRTVIEARGEREMELERARPKLSIKEANCKNIDFIELLPGGEEKQAFNYKVSIVNEIKSKLSSIQYALIPLSNGKLYTPRIELLSLYGEDKQEFHLSTKIDEVDIKPANLTHVFCFIRAIDVFGNTRDVIKHIVHQIDEDYAAKAGLIWRELRVIDAASERSIPGNYGGYTIEDIPASLIRSLINASRKYPSALQEFLLSFEDMKSEFKWFSNWKDIGKK